MLLVGLLGSSAASAAERPEPTRAIDGRLGAMLSTQVLDGPGPQLSLGWRWRFAAPWVLLGEVGAIRTTATQLTAAVPALGASAVVRGDVEQWTVPVLGGVGWSWTRATGRVGFELLAGLAVGRTRTLTGAATAGTPKRLVHVSADPMVKSRLEWSWPMRPGAVTLAGGWQHHFRLGVPTDPDVRITGPFVEAGWRVRF